MDFHNADHRSRSTDPDHFQASVDKKEKPVPGVPDQWQPVG